MELLSTVPQDQGTLQPRTAVLRLGDESMSTLYCRGVRGATTVDENDRDEILRATRQLLALLIRERIRKEDVASAIHRHPRP